MPVQTAYVKTEVPETETAVNISIGTIAIVIIIVLTIANIIRTMRTIKTTINSELGENTSEGDSSFSAADIDENDFFGISSDSYTDMISEESSSNMIMTNMSNDVLNNPSHIAEAYSFRKWSSKISIHSTNSSLFVPSDIGTTQNVM